MVIRVIVYANEDSKRAKKSLFERIINWSNDILFPYSHFDNVFRICFGIRSIICFEQSVL